MNRRKSVSKAVKWIGEEIQDTNCLTSTFRHYKQFQFQSINGGIGDYVLISNADAAEPDTEDGCDAACVAALYEDTSNVNDPFRAKVQWYSRPKDIPKWCFNNSEPVNFLDKEVIEDHRPFATDVSIETFYKKCNVALKYTKDLIENTEKSLDYICRYRLIALSKRKTFLEPVLEEERKALELLNTKTPIKTNKTSNYQTPKTPSSLIVRMERMALTEQKNWSVSKTEGTKLLLKRAIFADKILKKSPKKVTTKSQNDTPQTSKTLNKVNISVEEGVSMELQENSDEELPTLIIRRHVPSSPKRKQSFSKINKRTPKKKLQFEEVESRAYTTRSGRVTKNSVGYMEQDVSPVKRTPKKAVQVLSDSEDDFAPTPKTPRTPRTPQISRGVQTPKRSVTKRILTSQLTPSLPARTNSIAKSFEFLKENRPLPGRENQLDEILSFVKSNLLARTSGCMYISGVPGTGKTATVCSAFKILKDEVDLPDFLVVEVNGMKISGPRQAYVEIYKQLTGKAVVWEQACSLLEKRFTSTGPRRVPTVLLVDELDALCTRRQDVLYSILEWASHSTALLTVLAIANTMDLPERALAARVSSRLGLTRLTFAPYTHTQLQRIVESRLAGAQIVPDAIELIARKVAAVSGDARRALTLCSRAVELAGSKSAGIKEVERALTEAFSSATVRAIRCCSPAEQLILKAVAAEVERTGTEETTLSRMLDTAAAIVLLDGRPYKSATQIRAPTPSQALAICARLSSMRLLIMEARPAEPRLLLNVSTDDIHFATRQFAA